MSHASAWRPSRSSVRRPYEGGRVFEFRLVCVLVRRQLVELVEDVDTDDGRRQLIEREQQLERPYATFEQIFEDLCGLHILP
jgi:hypothetical protein